jgi:hypothetical protein
MAINYIYALRDPFTLERRYIGKTRDPVERYRKHLLPYYLKPDTYKNRWLKKVLRRNAKPILEILCEVTEWEDINQAESDFIRWLGCASRLTNGTLGGDGGNGHRPQDAAAWAIADVRRPLGTRRSATRANPAQTIRNCANACDKKSDDRKHTKMAGYVSVWRSCNCRRTQGHLPQEWVEPIENSSRCQRRRKPNTTQRMAL